jgi:hypothetical protein
MIALKQYNFVFGHDGVGKNGQPGVTGQTGTSVLTAIYAKSLIWRVAA